LDYLILQEYLKFTIRTWLRLAAAIKLLSRVAMGSPSRVLNKVHLIKSIRYLPEEIMIQVNQALMLHYDLE